jgi:hypothetical protein
VVAVSSVKCGCVVVKEEQPVFWDGLFFLLYIQFNKLIEIDWQTLMCLVSVVCEFNSLDRHVNPEFPMVFLLLLLSKSLGMVAKRFKTP